MKNRKERVGEGGDLMRCDSINTNDISNYFEEKN
jgi:hypothetical protein